MVLSDKGPMALSSSSPPEFDVFGGSSLLDESEFCAVFVSSFVSQVEVLVSFIGDDDVPRTAASTAALACT